jgi:hypothetical protein
VAPHMALVEQAGRLGSGLGRGVAVRKGFPMSMPARRIWWLFLGPSSW